MQTLILMQIDAYVMLRLYLPPIKHQHNSLRNS